MPKRLPACRGKSLIFPSQLDQKRVDHRIKMQKENPDFFAGRGYGHMGRGYGMGGGYAMGRGYGMGRGSRGLSRPVAAAE